MGIARSARADGHEVWLRHWDVRSLYDPPRRQPGALVSDIAGRRWQPEDNHHRKPWQKWAASRAKSVDRRAGTPMRLLPIRANHVGGRVAGIKPASDGVAGR